MHTTTTHRIFYRPLKQIDKNKIASIINICKKGQEDFLRQPDFDEKVMELDMNATVEAMKAAGYSTNYNSLLSFIAEKFSLFVSSRDLSSDTVEIQGKTITMIDALRSDFVWSPFATEGGRGLNPDFKAISYKFIGINSEGIPEYQVVETIGEAKAYIESGFRKAQIAGEKAIHIEKNPGLKLLLDESEGMRGFHEKNITLFCLTKRDDFFKKVSKFDKEVGMHLNEKSAETLSDIAGWGG